jgi:hypothetical protein
MRTIITKVFAISAVAACTLTFGGVNNGAGAANNLPPAGQKIIGMSAPAGEWAQRVKDVGSSVKARRIYADLSAGGNDQQKLIDASFKAGQMPVISYKVGGDYAGAKSGKYDAAAKQAAAMIAAYGQPATVTILHEPQGDVSAADFVAIQKRLVPLFQTGKIRVGPFLNGFLLDRQADTTFASFAPAELLKMWDFLGMDTYESGTAAAPGKTKPADRIPELVAWEKRHSTTLPVAIGEYNGYSAATIKAVGDTVYATPQVWLALMWNSNGAGKGAVLTGTRLSAFQATLKDPRNAS